MAGSGKNMDRRQFLRISTGSAAAMMLSGVSLKAEETKTQVPNILWVSCEDISPDLGCYGDKYAVTPNIDNLAAEGVRYTNAYSHAGVCAPARSGSLLREKTGQIDTRWMMRIARDRTGSATIDQNGTASSYVAILPDAESRLPVFWWCPSVPSNSCYVPFFVHGSGLPKIVSAAGTYGRRIKNPADVQKDKFSPQSYWWLFRDLSDKVRANRQLRNPIVREAFDTLEREFEAGVPKVIEKAVEHRRMFEQSVKEGRRISEQI